MFIIRKQNSMAGRRGSSAVPNYSPSLQRESFLKAYFEQFKIFDIQANISNILEVNGYTIKCNVLHLALNFSIYFGTCVYQTQSLVALINDTCFSKISHNLFSKSPIMVNIELFLFFCFHKQYHSDIIPTSSPMMSADCFWFLPSALIHVELGPMACRRSNQNMPL